MLVPCRKTAGGPPPASTTWTRFPSLLELAAPYRQWIEHPVEGREQLGRMRTDRGAGPWAMVGGNAYHPDSRTAAGLASSFYELPGPDSTCDDRDVVAEVDSYCSFTKAVEHLGDRWNLLIVADLVASGPQGFNALAARLPGRIARSVLAERLRRLTDHGLVGRSGGRGPYRLTPAGEGLASTLWALRDWSTTWLTGRCGDRRPRPGRRAGLVHARVAPGELPAQRSSRSAAPRAPPAGAGSCWSIGPPRLRLPARPLLDESSIRVRGRDEHRALVALARGR